MEEILQDPARFEELLREREKQPANPEEIRFASTIQAEWALTVKRAGGCRRKRRGERGDGVTTHYKVGDRESTTGALDLCPR